MSKPKQEPECPFTPGQIEWLTDNLSFEITYISRGLGTPPAQYYTLKFAGKEISKEYID